MASLALLLLAAGLADALKSAPEKYSTNAICRQNNCINPVFPGLNDLEPLAAGIWECQPIDAVKKYLQFCKGAVNYNIAMPSPNASIGMGTMVRDQEKLAVTTYFYHLAGMNLEAADYKDPSTVNDECVRSTWIMSCQTYFPKAQAGCREGEPTAYLRPCKNVCTAYVKACGVQCCDESVRCVFEHEKVLPDGNTTVDRRGYADQEGPSATCTGGVYSGARRGASFSAGLLLALLALVAQVLPSEGLPSAPAGGPAGAPRSAVLAAVVAAASVTLQGCDALGSAAGAWDSKPSFLLDFQFLPVFQKKAGGQRAPASQAVLNSCQVEGLSPELQCSGNGVCRRWVAKSELPSPITFCECDRDWADPECRTRRKSQMTAFLASLFGGFLGLDRFYLGDYVSGVAKLATLGGAGLWWVADIARLGSAPVYASEYRLAADLPHWVFVVTSVSSFALLGYCFFGVWAVEVQERRRAAKMLLEAEEDFFKTRSAATYIGAQDMAGMPIKSSYSMPAPPGGMYGALVPPEVHAASNRNPFSSLAVYSGGWRHLEATSRSAFGALQASTPMSQVYGMH